MNSNALPRKKRTTGVRRSLTGHTGKPMIFSAIAHAIVMCVLALFVIPIMEKEGFVIELGSPQTHEPTSDTFQVLNDAVQPPSPDDSSHATELSIEPLRVESLTLASSVKRTDSSANPSPLSSPASRATASAAAGSVEQAVDRVTEALQRQLAQGDLLVVWMLDASESLVDDRPRVADRLHPFFERIASQPIDGPKHHLSNALVSFGSKLKEHVSPTLSYEQVTQAIEKLPVDRTGKEQVFDAVQKCAEHYREVGGKKQLTLVIWTDESGDDINELDRTIAQCKKHRATVHVVGPSAVLGGQTGYHAFTDPKSDEHYQLPVLRGPDSAQVERLELGYWYFTPPPFREGLRRRFALPTWYGNEELEGMLSSFSPHALTRLTLATNGFYTILDSPEDQSPFDLDRMRAYAPDYASLETYDQQIKQFPLRAAVHAAVQTLNGKKVDEPNRMFFIRRKGDRQFDFDNYLYPADQFTSRYRTAVKASLQQATRAKKLVDSALEFVSVNKDIDESMESEYREEASPRWRAWYDLTRGRLLAFHVRLEEFRLTAEATLKTGGLKSDTNHVVFGATQAMQSSTDFRRRGEEATKLLQRCIDENLNTPWAYLADREMLYALGVEAIESTLTPSRLTPQAPSPILPKF